MVVAAAAAQELVDDYSESGKGQIYQASVAAPQQLAGSVLQDTGLRGSGLLVSTMIFFCIHIRHTLVSSTGAPKLFSIKVSPVKGSEGSRGEDGISDGVV